MGLGSIAHAIAAAFALDRDRKKGGGLEQTDFHPPAIALLEKPASPTIHAFNFVLILLVTAFLIWATVGRVDTVAEASGEVVASGRSKVIQPLESAIVRAIRVHDGQRVTYGQVLVELDASQETYDVANYRLQLNTARWAARQAHALAQLARGANIAVSDAFVKDGADDTTEYERRREIVERNISAMRERVKVLNDDIDAKTAALAAAREGAAKYAATVPLLRSRVEKRESLVAQGYQTEIAQSELRQQLIEMEKDYSSQQSRVEQASAELTAAEEEARRATQEFIAQRMTEYEDAQRTISEQTRNLNAAMHSLDRHTLVAPIDGTVQQLAVHTVGGVVTSAQQLMVIAPVGSEGVEVTAVVKNRDIGFVHVGQRVRIKVESYDFTRFGTIEGKIESVSADAARDDKGGLQYPVQIGLARTAVHAGAKELPLEPGMAVAAEIMIGSRTIAEYLMSPLRRTVDESLHER